MDPCPTAVGTQVVSSASSAVAQSELLNLLKQRLPESAGGPSSQVSPALPPAGPSVETELFVSPALENLYQGAG